MLHGELDRTSLSKNVCRFNGYGLPGKPRFQGGKIKPAESIDQSLYPILGRRKSGFSDYRGDHSCALGTWGGCNQRIIAAGEFGLIWLDAHMDAHTFATSPTGNVHGMPLAALLGKADKKLAAIYPGSDFIKPETLF